jgi:hypothetical protein
MDAIGPRVGLCHCPSCDSYACRWCWADYRGSCPTCRDPFVVPTTAGVAVLARLGATRRRVLRAPLAFTALVASVSILALTLGGQFRPAGGVQSTLRPPAGQVGSSSRPVAGGGSTAGPIALATGTAAPTGSPASPAAPAGGGGTAAGIPTVRPTARVAGATATPPATPRPRGATPPPTPPPTPRPTPPPTPVPTPACIDVPRLIDRTVADARAAWSGAGFTGSFSPAKGQNKSVVVSQSQPESACLPPSSGIAVTTRP